MIDRSWDQFNRQSEYTHESLSPSLSPLSLTLCVYVCVEGGRERLFTEAKFEGKNEFFIIIRSNLTI